MTSRKKKRLSKGTSKKVAENKFDEVGNELLIKGSDRNGTRSASEAFGDENDQSGESPARKKQNTATSTTEDRASEKPKYIARSSIDNGNGKSANDNSSNPGVDLAKDGLVASSGSLPDCSINGKKENVLDIAPPTMTAPTRIAAVETTSTIKVAGKTTDVDTTMLSPQNDESGGNTATRLGCDARADEIPNRGFGSQNGRTLVESFGWFAVFLFINLFILSWIIWTGLLLHERTSYQLDSLECRERLHQTYQAMGLGVDFEGVSNNDEEDYIRGSLEEQKHYWQDLENQVRYWKKEAKRFERRGDAFQEQCQEDLKSLRSEMRPN